ncbi:MAG: 16S rRNA (cytosine(1402)-N(4))-methyltransferase RsmH [Pirellulaceae bacterium]
MNDAISRGSMTPDSLGEGGMNQPDSVSNDSSPPSVADSVHETVLLNESVDALCIRSGMTIVDGTLGGAGHTRLIAERVGAGGKVLSLDADLLAVERTRQRWPGSPIEPVHANFSGLRAVLAERGIAAVDGLLLDLGLSSDQLADRERGFSFGSDGPLDLRFDTTRGASASDLLNASSEREIADWIFQFGEERASRRIAREIVAQRRAGLDWTADRLAALVARCVPRSQVHPIHPATRTFQALRIAVNGELESLELILRESPSLLKPGARIAIISFHSLEDRRVKEAFRGDPRWSPVNRKPILPSAEEVARNPRSRSAKLRVAERVPDEQIESTPMAPKRFWGA